MARAWRRLPSTGSVRLVEVTVPPGKYHIWNGILESYYIEATKEVTLWRMERYDYGRWGRWGERDAYEIPSWWNRLKYKVIRPAKLPTARLLPPAPKGSH